MFTSSSSPLFGGTNVAGNCTHVSIMSPKNREEISLHISTTLETINNVQMVGVKSSNGAFIGVKCHAAFADGLYKMQRCRFILAYRSFFGKV